MTHQEVRTESPPLPLNQVEISPDLVHDQSRAVVLDFLDYIFKALVVLNEAYHHMFPAPPPHLPCQHAPHQQGPRHLTDMAGQGGRMAFVGMLLRTADQIRYLKVQSVRCEQDFATKVKELKSRRPEIAHGVAVLNFLTAGLCRNDHQTLANLSHLVQALKHSCRTCRHEHPPIQLYPFYRENSSNCTLTLINALLAQCRVCRGTQYVKKIKEKLGEELDPSHRHGCSDCESILVDTLVYTNMLSITNFRMMASTRLSLDYVIDLRAVRMPDRVLNQLEQFLRGVGRSLFNLGFTEVGRMRWKDSGNELVVSMDFEVMFISGWQEEKKDDLNCLLLEGFLQFKEKRPFFIQCRHQLLRCDPQRKCCEPQMLANLYDAIPVLHYARSKLAGLLSFVSVHMMLEQDPCWTCQRCIIPSMIMIAHEIPLQIVSMLPFRKGSVFLERLTADSGPVLLKDDLAPFEERNVCMVHRRCKHVRCHTHCQYSKPGKVLAVQEATLYTHFSS